MSRISTTTTLQTPCPAPAALDPSHRRISSFELFGDETANIDYTRAIDQPLTGIKPRRRSMMAGPARKKAAPITIFEDVGEEEEMSFKIQEKKVFGNNYTMVSRSTLLGKPPAKRAQGGGGGIASRIGSLSIADSRTGGGISYQDHGTSAGPRMGMAGNDGSAEGRAQPSARSMMRSDGPHMGSTVRKPPRRQTIFVPEDTTVMTIHPGARDNTRLLDDTFHLPSLAVRPQQSQTETGTIEKPVRKPRHSLLVAPKRLPLRETPSTENIPGWDVAGANTGKENLPPAGQVVAQKGTKTFGVSDRTEVQLRHRSTLYAPTQATRNRQSIIPQAHAQLTSALPPARPGLKTCIKYDFRRDPPKNEPIRTIARVSINKFDASTRSLLPEESAKSLGSHDRARQANATAAAKADEEKQRIRDFIAGKRSEQQVARLMKYPVLEGNLSEPALYEDKWLSYQEVALTEVINRIFEVTSPSPTIRVSASGKSLRDQLIDLYNQPAVAMLHSRLHASMQCGALAHPRSTVSAHQPSQDLALRKRVMRMWLDTFNHQLLAEAAQVVAGRQLPRSTTHSSPSSSLDPKAGKRNYLGFLEDFFVCVVDADISPGAAGEELDTARWEKTVLRSLMLIWLLDQAAEVGIVDGGCLIKAPAKKKSTTGVVQMLGGMLLPACGDIMRALRHLRYDINYTQDALDEVVYHIDNIATDFRDGVFLTRLVETLLYNDKMFKVCSSARAELSIADIYQKDDNLREDSIAPRQQDGTVLDDCDLPRLTGGSMRTLSQYIKLPVASHSQKAYNVRVALGALSNHSVIASNIGADINAEDIINGHREKTLGLLWSLVRNYGLSYLVDWKQLAADVRRASGQTATIMDSEAISPPEQEELLQKWAAAYASKIGVAVDNLSTSFTDGKVYSTILDGFMKYLPEQPETEWMSQDPIIVEAQLRAFGCSNAFAECLAASIGVVTSRETVIGNLAVMASRLLPLIPEEDQEL